jgi:hypothetical protein
MRAIKILLIFLLVAVSALYGVSGITLSLHKKDTPPVLTSDREILTVSVKDGPEAFFAGITATDKQDGDLTGKVEISGISKLVGDNIAKITYIVFDSSDNLATLTRRVQYTDYSAPRFSVSEPLIYYNYESIALLDRVQVQDVIDGDITHMVRVSPLVTTTEADTYLITCQVTNSMGDTVSQVLPVIQISGRSSTVHSQVLLKDYLIYLKTGAAFNAKSYLSGVETADGTGSVSDVDIDGTVDTATPGTYMVRYTYHDSNGYGVAILTVVVE